ncbi:MAG: cyclase family protein [Planctomycetes bacterium]|nr:cyclase family protein [Planctomycetota bacterium]
MTSRTLIAWPCLPLIAGCSQSTTVPAGRIVDLTHEFSEQTIYWPTAQGFKLETEFHGTTERGYYYEANRYSASEHGGTHMDAPIHFCKTGATLDQVPLDRLIGPAAVIDVSNKTLEAPDYQVTIDDLTAWERKHGPIRPDVLLFIRTGFDRLWPDRRRYLGTELRGPDGVANLHFPGLHPDAARWLVANRRIKAFGIDTASIDYGQSKLFETHQVLFAAAIPALENVANLGRLPPTGAAVIALPMKIKNGSGGPVRIVALLPP